MAVEKYPAQAGLSKNMREARIRKGFSAAGLARTSGVSRQTVLDAESGARIPRPNSIKLIADALGTTPERLIVGESHTPSDLNQLGALARIERTLRYTAKLSSADIVLDAEDNGAYRLFLDERLGEHEGNTVLTLTLEDIDILRALLSREVTDRIG